MLLVSRAMAWLALRCCEEVEMVIRLECDAGDVSCCFFLAGVVEKLDLRELPAVMSSALSIVFGLLYV